MGTVKQLFLLTFPAENYITPPANHTCAPATINLQQSELPAPCTESVAWFLGYQKHPIIKPHLLPRIQRTKSVGHLKPQMYSTEVLVMSIRQCGGELFLYSPALKPIDRSIVSSVEMKCIHCPDFLNMGVFVRY